MNTKLLTLKTNHTILAEVVDDMIDAWKVKHTVQVVMQPTKDGTSVAFIPFLEFSDEFKTGIIIKKDDVLTVNTPVRELGNQYNQIFGSGITIATSIPKM